MVGRKRAGDGGSPVIAVSEPHPGDVYPDTKYVAGTNYCHLGLKIDNRLNRIIIISAIDNLGKGAAGQALQNMNVMFDLPEVTGLEDTALLP